MESLFSIGGLASGIDFPALAEQIIALEDRRLDSFRVNIAEREAQSAAYEEVRALLQAINSAASVLEGGSGINAFSASVLGAGASSLLSVSVGSSAEPGRHTVRVLQKAQREFLGSELQSSRSDALGLSGVFLAGGTAIEVDADDSLEDIAARINAADVGPTATGVGASIIGSEGSYRLVLTASESGAEGVQLADVSGILGTLGFVDGTSVLQPRTSGGFDSDALVDATSVVGTLRGLGATAVSGTVTLGSGPSEFTVALDLSTMSLNDVRDAINTAAGLAGSNVTAAIATETVDGETRSRLEINGTANAVDDGGVLATLGVLEGGRSAVNKVVQGDVLSSDAGGTAATAATQLSGLFLGGVAAGVSVGDTLTFEGSQHDGTAFSFVHTVQAGDTLQTLIDRLEGAEGFDGSATVEVSADGRLTATSATGGPSQVSLAAFAGNEGGGVLDLGDFQVTAEGRSREIAAGSDALVEINGSFVSSATNQIDDILPGISLSILGADPDSTLEVVVDRDVASGVAAVKSFVDAFNAFAAYVDAGIGVIGDENRPPLAGDSIVRGMRRQLQTAIQTVLSPDAIGSFGRLADIGIEVTREGTFSVDTAALESALRSDPESVQRLFGAFGSTSTSSLRFITGNDDTTPGTYDINVTQLATAAILDSVGFGGTYVDDGTADTLGITDLATGGRFEVALTNGMTLAQIVDALNTEFAIEMAQEITAERTLYSDAGATTEADETTLLQDLHHGVGASSGFVVGTEITISGTRRNGSSVLDTFVVSDPVTQTLGDLRDAIQQAFGSGVEATIANGQVVVSDVAEGSSQLSVSIGSDVVGNETPLGAMQVSVTGRDAVTLTAEDVGGELRISHPRLGSKFGFTVDFTAGGADGSASLGLAAGNYAGLDVIGTINGELATGDGDLLTGDDGTLADGLTIRVGGSTTGALGTVTFSAGAMSNATEILDGLLGTGSGSIDGIVGRLDEAVVTLQDRLSTREARLEFRREELLRRFAALEQALASAQNQSAFIAAQIASLPQARNRSSGSSS